MGATGRPQPYRSVRQPLVQERHDSRNEKLGRVFGCSDQYFVVIEWGKGVNGVGTMLHDVASPDSKFSAVTAEGDSAALWNNESAAELSLKPADVSGHCGRGQMQCIGGPAHTENATTAVKLRNGVMSSVGIRPAGLIVHAS